jgi:homoserine/homoserine lactone efflux protein
MGVTETLLWFGITEFFLSLSPGPAVLLVMSVAMRKGVGAGISASFGILAVNVLYFILSAVGIGALLVASPGIFHILKIIGAAYLAWIAADIILELTRPYGTATVGKNVATIPSRGNFSIWHEFFKGVITQASSVKVIMIFVAIIPQFVDPGSPPVPQFIALCIVSVLVELPVLLGYTYLAHRLSSTVKSQAFHFYIDGLSAVILLMIAGSILITA